jgi:hypothetical protein
MKNKMDKTCKSYFQKNSLFFCTVVLVFLIRRILRYIKKILQEKNCTRAKNGQKFQKKLFFY